MMNFLDQPHRYGLISRALHWGMALLLFWQYASMITRIILGRHPVSAFMVGSHAHVGTVLLALVLIRGAWGLFNASRRPAHENTVVGRAAALGHLALYGLMLVIPTVSLIRQFGSERAFSPLGIPLWSGRPEPVDWLEAIGDTLHGELAWILSALIIGHIAMVWVHQTIWRDDTLSRMAPVKAKALQQRTTAAEL